MEAPEKPVFKRADHVSLTVSDLDATVRFYVETMGASLIYRMGPFDAAEIPAMEDGRDWTDAHVNVKGARLEIAMIKIADNLNMELFAYEKPDDARKDAPRNCDVGARHVCMEVDDIHKAIAYLSAHGCKAMSGPIVSKDGPCPPSMSWYVLDPFGIQLELVEYLN
ncbi:MAG: VOC family protein [Parvularculaceae bacterium]|nr:VOC family protein [Parvularculaceae bacterium]